MATQRWKASQDFHDELIKLIGANHPKLVGICDDIVIIFKEKCSRIDGVLQLGRISKASPILEVLGERPFKYVIELGYDGFQRLEEEQKLALLDHLLCHVGATEDEANGEMKYHSRTPDICYFSENRERYGDWYPILRDEETTADGEKKEKVPHNQKQQSLLDDEE